MCYLLLAMAETNWFARIESQRFFDELAPNMTIGRWSSWLQEGKPGSGRSVRSAETFDHDGLFFVDDVITGPRCADMADAVLALRAAGLPALFAYVYDQFWEPLAVAAQATESLIGPVVALADIWAWYLSAGGAEQGWAAHRGTYALEKAASGATATVNVWIPLVDVCAENACMWAVPLSDDPDYPANLERCSGIAAGKPLPARAGTLVGWNANVLHWGGQMSPKAKTPRISLSFTLRAADNLADYSVLPGNMDFRARLDLIAQMVGTYVEHVTELPNYVVRWAAMIRQLSVHIQRAGLR